MVTCAAMDVVIISIGAELTTGQTVDANATWLSARLTELGATVVGRLTIGDDLGDIRGAIRQALARADTTILTGGLGPTPDDLTRLAVAEAIDRPLEEHAGAIDAIREIFDRMGRTMSPSNTAQAMIPTGCEMIPNAHGTACGISYKQSGKRLVALPGVPSEMMAMFEEEVRPLLTTVVGSARISVGILQCFGISESKVGELLADMMARDRNPQVGTTVAQGVIGVRVRAVSGDEADAHTLLRSDMSETRRRLGHAVFGEGEDTLESVVGGMLKARGLTLATAESCTGGLLAKRLTDIPGSSAYFLRGYVTYADAAKTDLLGVSPELMASHGAVSEQAARAMASACRTAASADFALSLTGIAGPAGGDSSSKPVGLVYIGMADEGGVEVKTLRLGEHLRRGEIRERACSAALNLLRLRLLSLDVNEPA